MLLQIHLNLLFGGGTGSSEQLMDRLYRDQRIDWEFVQKKNTRNQYIDFLLNTGFVGLAIFFWIFALLSPTICERYKNH
jgi:hypothetical protein